MRAELKRKEKLNFSQSCIAVSRHESAKFPTLKPEAMASPRKDHKSCVNLTSILLIPQSQKAPLKTFERQPENVELGKSFEEFEKILSSRRLPPNSPPPDKPTGRDSPIGARRASIPLRTVPREIKRTGSGIGIAVYNENSQLMHYQAVPVSEQNRKTNVVLNTEKFYAEYAPGGTMSSTRDDLQGEIDELKGLLRKAEEERSVFLLLDLCMR